MRTKKDETIEANGSGGDDQHKKNTHNTNFLTMKQFNVLLQQQAGVGQNCVRELIHFHSLDCWRDEETLNKLSSN